MTEHETETTGHWPDPDALTDGELRQLDKAVAGIRVMLAKALYHYRTKGHLCTFHCDSHIRVDHILQEGYIRCDTTEGRHA